MSISTRLSFDWWPTELFGMLSQDVFHSDATSAFCAEAKALDMHTVMRDIASLHKAVSVLSSICVNAMSIYSCTSASATPFCGGERWVAFASCGFIAEVVC